MRDRSAALFYIAFFVTGFATVLTANLLPSVLSPGQDAIAGRLLALQFSGQLIAALFVRRRVALTLILGLAVTAVFAILLAFSTSLHWAALFLYGWGLGASMTAINVLAAQGLDHAERTRRLEALNVFWPLGAATCPWVLSRLPARHEAERLFAAVAIAFILLAVWAWLKPGITERHTHAHADEKVWTRALIRPALLSLFAVGAETGLASFLPVFQARYLPGPSLRVPLATLFWAGILVSRTIASLMARYPFMRVYHRLAVAGAAVAVLLLVMSHSRLGLSVFCFLGAAGIGPVYPEVLTGAVQLPWPGPVFFSAGVGSALIPWSIGHTSAAAGSLRQGLLVVCACCVTLFALTGRSNKGTRRR